MSESCDRCDPPDAPEADPGPSPHLYWQRRCEARAREVERLRTENERLRAAAVSAVSRLAAMGDFPGADDLAAMRELLAAAVYGDMVAVGEIAVEAEKGAPDAV